MKDEQVFFTYDSELYGHLELSRPRHRVSCTIPRLALFAGGYELRIFLVVDGRSRSDYLDHAVEFQVDDAHFFPTGKTPKEKVGVLVDQAWRIE